MRKREPQKIKLVFSLKMRLFAFALLGAFLYFKLMSYHKVTLAMDQMEMMPMLMPGQTLYLYSHAEKTDYQAGDTVYYKKDDEDKFHFARIVAKDQGSLRIENRNLFVGDNLHLPTQDSLPSQLQKNYDLKPGELFLVQDQQGASWMDSIAQGPIPIHEIQIKGKLFFYMEQSEEGEGQK